MNTDPVYFLLKYKTEQGCYTVFSAGTRINSISEPHLCHIMRFYPMPTVNLTTWFRLFQRRARQHVRRRRWLRHPLRLRHRELYGAFPLYPKYLL